MRRIPIEDFFDLHSFRAEDVGSALSEYLREAIEVGYSEVRIVHGKGIGERRAQVRRILGGQEDVLEFFDAPPQRGGFGATIAKLRLGGAKRNPDGG